MDKVKEYLHQLIDKRYRIDKYMTAGGMAYIFQGIDLKTKNPIAIKIFKNGEKSGSFQNEISILRRVRHKNIQQILAYGTFEGTPFYIMPYIKARNLRQHIDDQYNLLEKHILDYFLQISSAVSYLHRKRIIHNDLKPQNILVTDDEHLILSDFGLARHVPLLRRTEVRHGSIWGSPVYLAPELVDGEPSSYRSDVYALGVILYILYMGYPPFYHDDMDELIKMHQTYPIPDLHRISNCVSEEITSIIQRALDKQPKERFSSATAFSNAIKGYCKEYHTQISTRSISRRPDMLAITQKTKKITGVVRLKENGEE